MTPTLDVPGAAGMLKIHPKTVLDLISAGALPAAKVGRSYVLLTSDVLRHLENQIVRQTAARLGEGKKPQPASRARRPMTCGARP